MSAPQPKRNTAGFWSSARSFFLPVGPQIDPAGVRGYPIDMRVKASSTDAGAQAYQTIKQLHCVTAQYGLGCFERWLNGDGEVWLQAAIEVGRALLSDQEDDGSWLHRVPFPHTWPLPTPWRSAMAQGEAASLLVRLYLETRDEQFATGARLALDPCRKSPADGGVRAAFDRGWWLEEYPTDPPSYVLNGAIFALWGIRDVAVGLGDPTAAAEFAEGLETLVSNLPRFDTGWWSRYALFPHRMDIVASSFYHDLHINQLRAMDRLSPDPVLTQTADRWATYAASVQNRRRAFVSKVAFRLVVPRNRLLAGLALRGFRPSMAIRGESAES